MTTEKTLEGKPHAGNPHVRLDEGEVAPTAKPRRETLLCSKLKSTSMATLFALAAFAGTLGLLAADHTLLWSYDDSGHPADVKVLSASQPLQPALDTREYYVTTSPFGLPLGLVITFR